MWAHDGKGAFQHIGDKWWVELHGLPEPVVPVTVTEVDGGSPDGTHWGWIAAGRDKPVMIWAFEGAFGAQFPYGVRAEEEAGKGRAVRLQITRREVPEEA
jgi:hypothetical protein